MKENRSAFKVALLVSMGGFIFGFDASVIFGVFGIVVAEFNLNNWQQSRVTGAPTPGAVIAALGVGPLSDQIGAWVG